MDISSEFFEEMRFMEVSQGQTSALDNGLPTRLFEDFICSHGHLISSVKLGWGTSLVTKDLKKKLSILREHDIPCFPGGSLFEKAYSSNCLDQYMRWCERLGFEIVEVSNGTIPMEQDVKSGCISRFSSYFTVYSEVGFKDQARSEAFSPSLWISAIEEDLDAGARMVITESRESGNSGICRRDGEVRYGLIEDILLSQVDVSRLLFEAPSKDLQVYFIKKIGVDVNLANISFNDLVPLATLRLGLRSDTLLL